MGEVSIARLMGQSGVAFGTSGARGRVAAMTPEVCYAYTRAFLQHQEACGDAVSGGDVAIAGDLRPSTPAIMAAVALAVRDAGYVPVNCGFIPSPAVALFGIQRGIPSIMVTGSHIPDDRNGIKFNKPAGEILKPDEEAIRAQTVVVPEGLTAGLAEALPAVDDAAQILYIDRYADFFGSDALAGMRIGLYEHSGVGRDIIREILTQLGAEVVRLGRSEVFIPVDTEAVRDEDVVLAREWVREYQLDGLISTDGDADRPLVGTEQGEWIRGDVAGVLCARFLGIDRIVTPVSSNSVVEKCGWFDRVLRTRIGSPYVIEGMQSLADVGISVAGYEANGGFLLNSPVARAGATLAPLPTRDAVIVALALLSAAKAARQPMSRLLASLPPRFTASDRLKEFPTERSGRCIEALLDDNGRGEGEAIQRTFADIPASVVTTDTTDGLRITLDNDEIIHLRPSGNAPEFRCYNEAESAERVEQLNKYCMSVLEKLRE